MNKKEITKQISMSLMPFLVGLLLIFSVQVTTNEVVIVGVLYCVTGLILLIRDIIKINNGDYEK